MKRLPFTPFCTDCFFAQEYWWHFRQCWRNCRWLFSQASVCLPLFGAFGFSGVSSGVALSAALLRSNAAMTWAKLHGISLNHVILGCFRISWLLKLAIHKTCPSDVKMHLSRELATISVRGFSKIQSSSALKQVYPSHTHSLLQLLHITRRGFRT